METNAKKNDAKIWPDSIIKDYIHIMVDEVTKGNMQNGIFHTRIWNSIKYKLNSISNRSFSIKQIKQKFHRLRTRHHEFSLLLQYTGFGWDAKTNTVMASEEVWQSYIRVHPDAAQFQKKGCEHYKLLGILLNRSTATGVLCHSSTQDPPNTNEELELENQYLNNGVHVDVNQDSSDDDL
ncbi:L10-interacting MYB domain-containing protein-like [Gastrolobium bilobum]|uniref:L10-interacting MYB domain-containing protein-like n=1 Tax=Gastrolobium bilobum TaxID=150636 RepID=UPI002AAF4EFC|nr:L10-interacting MYB domain-containing protein-like [Gastrolobium bilobum]